MRTHREIDERSLAMVRAIVDKIDADPDRAGLAIARSVAERWRALNPSSVVEEWWSLVQRPWTELRALLLSPNEEGCRLRQSHPFVGILTPQERWAIYRSFRDPAPA